PATKGEAEAKGEAEEKGEGSARGDGAGKVEGNEKNAEAKARFSEQALFSDPYGILARIAAEAATVPPPPPGKEGTGAGGENYRAPFDPGVQPTGKRPLPPAPKVNPADTANPAEALPLSNPPAPPAEAKQLAETAPAMGQQGPQTKVDLPAPGE